MTKPRYTARMTRQTPFVLAFLCAASLSAQAQWQWLDSNGKRVFSDRPPALDVPEKNILRRPGGAPSSTVPAQPAASASATAPSTAANLPKVSGKDTELEKKKAQAEALESAKKKAEEDKNAAAKADNCERSRRALGTLQSGARISQINSSGEREFMSDETRASEIQRLEGIAATDCK